MRKYDHRLWLKPADYPSWLCPSLPEPPAIDTTSSTVHVIYDEPDEVELQMHQLLKDKYDRKRRKNSQ